MNRRKFIALLGTASAVSPCIALAQNEKLRRVGLLANAPWPPIDGLRDGLRELGHTEGQNLELVYRYAQGDAERFTALAEELVQRQVDVIVTWGTPPSLAAKAATQSIPIVITSGDPIAVKLVPGLAYPGGNVTGLSTQAAELEGKRLEIMHELLPHFSAVAVLSNSSNPYCAVAVESARRGAATLRLKFDVVDLVREGDLDEAFRTLRGLLPDGLLVVADPLLASHQSRIAAFLVEAKMPSIYTYREQVAAGGLVSYAANYYVLFRRAAGLADKILKGTKPGDIPVEQPTKFELVINLRTAKAIGLSIPDKMLALADEVIE